MGGLSMRPDDSVLVWLGKARQDILALTALRDEPGIEAEILGFHAQQAAEKLLKAVLCALGVALPRTHRLSDLIDLLRPRAPNPASPGRNTVPDALCGAVPL